MTNSIHSTMNRNPQPGTRILAQNIIVSNDTRKTGLNNNDIIIGPSGSGKTGGYVIPNIQRNTGSMVIADTKGNLCKKLAPQLAAAGYTVNTLDFVRPENSCYYNPLDYIDMGMTQGSYREQDILTISDALMPVLDKHDPFWENAAKSVLTCLIAFVKEALPENECNLFSVLEMVKQFQTSRGKTIFEELAAENPDSYAVRQFKGMTQSFDAEKMWGSIIQFALEALKMFDFKESRNLYTSRRRFRIEDLGRRKMALFVNVSDTDRAFDNVVNLFYTQLFHVLCKEADRQPENRLKIPVRIILDDFATNIRIPCFDKIISVIRSREISVSLILQSITQLETMYSPSESKTIINNCDHMLYLGGQDVDTASYIGSKANRTTDSILNMALDDVYLFARGEKPRLVEKVAPYSSSRNYESKENNQLLCSK